jgi:hypothetical protein
MYSELKKFEFEGVTFCLNMYEDDCTRAPWAENHGHGDIREISVHWGRNIPKRAGEVLMHSERAQHWLYDFASATQKAKAEGWGLCEIEHAALLKKLGHEPTAREVAKKAVEKDMQFCRAYLRGDVYWACLEVWDESAPSETESLCGVLCSGFDSYCAIIANDLADDLLRARAAREADLQLAYVGL